MKAIDDIPFLIKSLYSDPVAPCSVRQSSDTPLGGSVVARSCTKMRSNCKLAVCIAEKKYIDLIDAPVSQLNGVLL